jgi:DNA-binding response OmpR family regulator
MAARTILIVDDDPLIGMMLADMVDALGYGTARLAETIEAADAVLAKGDVAAALLDINIGGVKIWPLADRLAAAGISYAFLSGGGDVLPAPHDSRPMVMKPFRMDDIDDLLCGLFAGI